MTFTPTAQGPRTGTLTVNNNAPGGPQTVALSGNGASDFVLGVDPGTPSSDTVKAGSAATYSIEISPVGGFNQTVVLECSGEPAGVSCTVSPASATLDGANYQTVTVNVKTTAASATPPGPPGGPPVPGSSALNEWWLALVMLLMMVMTVRAFGQWRRRAPLLAGTVLLAAIAVSCGGGGGGGSGGRGTSIPATPAGTYTLMVTGTSGDLQHQTTLTLTVQ